MGLFPLGGPGLARVSAVRFSAPHASTLALALQPALCVRRGRGGGFRTPPRRIVYFSRFWSCFYFTLPIFKLFSKENLNLHEHPFLLPLPPPKKNHPAAQLSARAQNWAALKKHKYTPRRLNNKKVTLARMKLKRWGRRHFQLIVVPPPPPQERNIWLVTLLCLGGIGGGVWDPRNRKAPNRF